MNKKKGNNKKEKENYNHTYHYGYYLGFALYAWEP
jgi:hypothetical protein